MSVFEPCVIPDQTNKDLHPWGKTSKSEGQLHQLSAPSPMEFRERVYVCVCVCVFVCVCVCVCICGWRSGDSHSLSLLPFRDKCVFVCVCVCVYVVAHLVIYTYVIFS